MAHSDFSPRSLPYSVSNLCERLNAQDYLVAHLRLVHDTAVQLIDGLHIRFPNFLFNKEEILWGAATHDIGKIVYPSELHGPGNLHEAAGQYLLEQNGVSESLARFCRTHGAWADEDLPLEDLLVALADTVWKGQRSDELEAQIVDRIAEMTHIERWQIFSAIDQLLEEIAAKGEQRMAWQLKAKESGI